MATPGDLLQFEEVNQGWVTTDVIHGLTREELWAQFVIKVRTPNLYLPCIDVSYKDQDDGSVWRTMTIPPGAFPIFPDGKTIVENIVMDEDAGDVAFRELDGEGKLNGLEHHNRLHAQPGGGFKIEYVDLQMPAGTRSPLKASVAISKIVEYARKASAEKAAA